MENTSVIQVFLAIGVVIAFAQFFGAAARALGQPRVLGELLAGVILGPTLLNLLHWGTFDDPALLRLSLDELAELGVLFLMFAVGLEVHLRELLAVGRVALWGGTLGAVLPVLLSAPLIVAFDHSSKAAIFMGVVLAATSVSISAQTLLELGLLRTKEGMGLLATAVVDDVLAILMLSVVVATLGVQTNVSVSGLAWTLTRMVLYVVGALAVAWFVLPPLFNRLQRTRYLSSGLASFALIAALIFGWSADVLGGIAAITGAFIAGVGLSQTGERVHAEIEETVRRLSYSFLVPIFFVNVGLHIDLTLIGIDLLPLTALLTVAAIGAKVIGSGVGARLGGFDRGESFRLGVCMISRGEVGLIIASLGLAEELLTEELFDVVFVVILLTTIITPPLVRWVFHGHTPTPTPVVARRDERRSL